MDGEEGLLAQLQILALGTSIMVLWKKLQATCANMEDKEYYMGYAYGEFYAPPSAHLQLFG